MPRVPNQRTSFEAHARSLARDAGWARSQLLHFEPFSNLRRLDDAAVLARLEAHWAQLPPGSADADQRGLAMLGYGNLRAGLVPALGSGPAAAFEDEPWIGEPSRAEEPAPAPAPAAAKPPPWPEQEPTSFAECEQRLEAARLRIDRHGFQPKYSDAQLMAMDPVQPVTDRFMVHVREKPNPGDPQEQVIGYRRTSGRTTSWTAPFDQVEDADKDAKLLTQKLAMDSYSPDDEYEMFIIDTQTPVPMTGVPGAEGAATGQPYVFVPTRASVTALGKQEFADKFSDEVLEQAMSEEYAGEYARLSEQLDQQIAAKGHPKHMRFNQKTYEAFADEQIGGGEQQELFLARHTYTCELGTNPDFLGNGLTKQIGKPGKQYGAQETLTFEKNPPTVAQRERAGNVKRVSL